MPDEPPPPPVPGQERPTRICLVYDCRYPVSHGGAEKWLRNLAEALASQGAQITYLHGAGRSDDRHDGVHWVGLTEAEPLYRPNGVRRLLPAFRFSLRVARHLRSRDADYDLVYVHDMPILPVLGAWWGLRPSRAPWVVEWIEWWSARYWRSYAGPIVGTAGYLAQRLALALTPLGVCYSALTARELRSVRPGLPIAELAGQAPGTGETRIGDPQKADLGKPPQPPVAVFLGRFVPHKRPHLALDAVLRARAQIPELRLLLVGHGPEETSLRRRVAALGEGIAEVLSGAGDEEVRDILRRASVLVHPSAREGFGLVVAEANRLGVPVVLVDGPENAAPELIRLGGGTTVHHADAREIGEAIVSVIRGGEAVRGEALANAERLGRERSVTVSCRQLLDMARRSRDGAPPII